MTEWHDGTNPNGSLQVNDPILNNDDYFVLGAVIGHDLNCVRKNSSERPWYNESDTEERNAKAKKAYEALMTVTLRKPTNQRYREFSQDVKKRAEKLYKNFTYGEDEVSLCTHVVKLVQLNYAQSCRHSGEIIETNKSSTPKTIR
ncbi:hypothetical protein Btru_040292, partial [Bulinus truncatus]